MCAIREKTILLTCAKSKADKFKKLLAGKEMQVICFPLIHIEPAINNEAQIRFHFSKINCFDYVVFTSSHGVKYFFYWLEKIGTKADFNKLKFAAIGKATSKTLKNYGINTIFKEQSNGAAAFGEKLLKAIQPPNKNILFPCGNMAKQSLEQVVEGKHSISRLVVYNTIEQAMPFPKLIDALNKNIDALLPFLSPSAVRAFVKTTANEVDLQKIKAIPIGKTTKLELEKHGMKALFMPNMPNIETLIIEMENYFRIQNNNNGL